MKQKLFTTNFYAALFAAGLLFTSLTVSAQVKIGLNPATIGANSNLEVEGTNSKKVIVKKDVGTVVIENTPSGAVTDSVVTVNTVSGDVRSINNVKLRSMLGMSGNGAMSRTTNQSLAPGVGVTPDFTTIITNELGSINLTADAFIVKVAGTYTFSATTHVLIPGTLAVGGRANIDMYLQANTGAGYTNIARTQAEQNAAVVNVQTVTVTGVFNVGDVVRVIVQPCSNCFTGPHTYTMNRAEFFGIKHF